jgi:ribonuclease HI
VLAWQYSDAPAQTSMEAEYQAVIAGLRFVLARYAGAHVRCLSDCRVVVEQLNGRCAVRAARLKPLNAQAAALALRLGRVEFISIPRDMNHLADALAGFQAAQDRVVGLLRRNEEMNG